MPPLSDVNTTNVSFSSPRSALFGTEPCRSTLIAAQRTGLWLDALGFIPAYTTFLCLAAWATRHRLRGGIIAALLVAGLCDEIEGAQLFAIVRDLPGTPGQLDALWWPVHVKFALLAIGTAAIGSAILARSLSAMLLGLLVTGFGLGAIVALVVGAQTLMMQWFMDGWAALLLAAGVGAVWPRLLAPRPRAPVVPSA